jgi:hypothetical protein
MKPASKRPFLYLALLTLIALVVLIVLVINTQTPIAADETVFVPFDSAAPVLTTRKYQDWIALTIKGWGKTSLGDFADPFYKFAVGGVELANPITEPQYYGIIINGDKYAFTVMKGTRPPYDRGHIYNIRYYAGATPNYLSFEISADNRSSIRAASLSKLCPIRCLADKRGQFARGNRRVRADFSRLPAAKR